MRFYEEYLYVVLGVITFNDKCIIKDFTRRRKGNAFLLMKKLDSRIFLYNVYIYCAYMIGSAVLNKNKIVSKVNDILNSNTSYGLC